MDHRQLLLTQLGEECNEIAIRVSKIMRFGPNDIQDGHKADNMERLAVEIDDLEGVLAMLRSKQIIHRPNISNVDAKIGKIIDYAAYSVKKGILSTEEYEKLIDVIC